MKQLLALAVAVWTTPLLAAHGDLIEVPADYMFVPTGFDDNDEVEIVLDGYLPSYCYRLTQPGVEVNIGERKILVQQGARYFPALCFDIPTPFTAIVRIGRLPTGHYEMATRDGRLKEKLSVAASRYEHSDDHFYAPVEAAHIISSEYGHRAILEGRFTSKCFSLREVRVLNRGKIVEVLPIIGYRETEPGCPKNQNWFREEVAIPRLDAAFPRVLLHVRSANGRSVNTVFSQTPKND